MVREVKNDGTLLLNAENTKILICFSEQKRKEKTCLIIDRICPKDTGKEEKEEHVSL